MYAAAAGDGDIEAVADFDVAVAAAADADFAAAYAKVGCFDIAAAADADFEGVGIAGELDIAGAADGETEIAEVIEGFGGNDFAAAADGQRLYAGEGDVNFDVGIIADVVLKTDVPGAVSDFLLEVVYQIFLSFDDYFLRFAGLHIHDAGDAEADAVEIVERECFFDDGAFAGNGFPGRLRPCRQCEEEGRCYGEDAECFHVFDFFGVNDKPGAAGLHVNGNRRRTRGRNIQGRGAVADTFFGFTVLKCAFRKGTLSEAMSRSPSGR